LSSSCYFTSDSALVATTGLSSNSDLLRAPISGADRLARFHFYSADEIEVLLLVIPRLVKRPMLLLDLPQRLLPALEFAQLDSYNVRPRRL